MYIIIGKCICIILGVCVYAIRGNCISTTIGSYVHTIIEICIHTAIDKCMLTLIGSISTYREISLSLMKRIAGSVAELLMSFRREGPCAQQTRRRNVSARVHQHILRRFHLAWWRKNRRERGKTFADLHAPERYWRDLNDAGTRRVEVGNSRGSKGGGGERGYLADF